MPRPCTVCQHPDLLAINKALVERVPLRAIEGRYGLSRSSLGRHQNTHPLFFGYEPMNDITWKDFYKYLWQFSVRYKCQQYVYCPLCKPDYPSAVLSSNQLMCDVCGLHSLELVVERMGFEIIPYYGYKEKRKANLEERDAYMTKLLQRYEASMDTGKPFHMPRLKWDKF